MTQEQMAIPPHNIEAEEAVIGSILIDNQAFYDANKFIGAGDFYLVKNRWIWEAAAKLVADRMPIDLLTIQEQLESEKRLAEIGGPAYLTRLVTLTPSAFNAGAYASLVREAADRRRLIRLSSDIAKLAFDVGSDIETVKANALRALLDGSRIVDGAEHIAGAVSELYDETQELSLNPRDLIGMDSGFPDYNEGAGGIHRGEMLVIAGEPGVGKSMFAGQLGYNLASNEHAGAIYSMEMRKKSVVRRWVSSSSNIPTRKIRTGRMDDSDWPAFTQAITQASQLPIYISQATHWTTTAMRSDLTRLKAEYGIEWFVLDYFDLLKDRAADENREQKIKSIGIKDICQDLDLAGIIIHTFNKAGMRSSDYEFADVSGSRQIIYDADVLLYFTKHKPQNGDAANPNLRTVRFGKFREENTRAYFEVVMGGTVPRIGNAATAGLPIPEEDMLVPYPDPD